jgi:hypothetical protein
MDTHKIFCATIAGLYIPMNASMDGIYSILEAVDIGICDPCVTQIMIVRVENWRV